jgi:hypothetical protein
MDQGAVSVSESDYRAWCERTAAIGSLRKLFVVGCAKSGTTWLQHLLNGHPEICIDGEGRYFWPLAQYLNKAFTSFNESLPKQGHDVSAWWSDTEFACLMRHTIEVALSRTYVNGGSEPGLQYIGDKTPMHTLAVGSLHQLFPEARFIHIIRDPRDATISQWIFWAKANDPRSFEEFVEYSITKVWPLNVESARKAGRPLGPLYTEVRYEDLIENPADEMTRLCQFLGVDDASGAIEACLANGDFKKHSGGRTRGNDDGDGNLYRKGVAGDWMNHIPVDLANRCCAQVETLMHDCGYEARVTQPV